MKYFPLVWRNLLRRKVRTLFTMLSILVAFVLFGILMAIRAAFSMGVDVIGADRLIVIHKVSFIQPLPGSYKGRIAAMKGVSDVTHANWFGGYYQDPSNFFANMAVDPESWFRIYSEFTLPEDQKKAWLENRTGAVIGRDLANRFGWKIGDRVPLQGTIYRNRDNTAWEFTIDGIYDAGPGVDKTQLFFHYPFLNESRQSFGRDQVGWYVFKIANPDEAVEVAKRIDALFANSPAETKTTTEKAFVSDFAKQIGDIGTIMIAIVVAVMFTMLLVTGNTMAQSIRERTNELAVLKTLGFGNGRVLGMVLFESCLIAILGGALGLAISWALVANGDPTNGLLPAWYFPPRALVAGCVLVVALGLAAGILPAWQAGRLKIVEALRRN